MQARYNYRIYPNEQQQKDLSRLFGCVRLVWNDTLAFCLDLYRQGEKKPRFAVLSKRLTIQKRLEKFIWLNEVSSVPLQQSLRDLEQAYSNFFNSAKGKRKGRKVRPPRFKKRRARQGARFTRDNFKVNEKTLTIPKIGELEIVWSRELPSIPSSVTIIKDAAERYFASFVVEIIPEPLADNGQSVGIDLGIKTFATLSSGEKIDAPKPLKKRLKKLKKAQRKLSRTKKGSKRRERARKRVAKMHTKIKDTRTDFLHKTSTRIVRENQTIVLEDLNVGRMMKNRKLSRAISDLGWYSFREMLEAKSEKYGRDFRVINRFEPTTQRCSCCGELGGKKPLDIREWECLFCGAKHDRDRNAAINIEQAVLGRRKAKNGRGGDVRRSLNAIPVESSTRPKVEQLSLLDFLGIPVL